MTDGIDEIAAIARHRRDRNGEDVATGPSDH
jgi:hypothetical protein